ncbi:MAG: hypothetical protein LJE69_00020 [Thiohalocapsa sp.]|jgi:small-conductance mechanosensitive channel|uniref:hypothetical protein n=1 Tax=Thiohalocapsa sp. TaxID=2497641 RepID=UPI0025FAE042|nr:hypothetical protein [Thiohalocapsa sp.]MCG6939623.1 hypothetical protein [Thiohalocapsa sp.]
MEQDAAARITALEAELASVRAEAEAERERFDRRLKLAQSALPERRDPRTVTQNIAAQQEIDALRGALRERDRVVKELTQQVRSLEDQLEDSYRQMDAVRRQLGQREQELVEARRQAEIASRRAATPPPAPPPPSRLQQRPPPRPPSQERMDAVTFAIGLFVGALLACAVAVSLWWTGHWPAAPDGAGGLASASVAQDRPALADPVLPGHAG